MVNLGDWGGTFIVYMGWIIETGDRKLARYASCRIGAGNIREILTSAREKREGTLREAFQKSGHILC